MTRANPQEAEEKGPDDQTGKPEREFARDKRRADALRANLKRRKAQLRGRKVEEGKDESAPPLKDET